MASQLKNNGVAGFCDSLAYKQKDQNALLIFAKKKKKRSPAVYKIVTPTLRSNAQCNMVDS